MYVSAITAPKLPHQPVLCYLQYRRSRRTNLVTHGSVPGYHRQCLAARHGTGACCAE